MKLFGVGTDIIQVKRLKKSMQKKFFLPRIFSKEEIIKCNKIKRNTNCFAKRFAAKEAFSKALGTGISKGINFNEIIRSYFKTISKNRYHTLNNQPIFF